MKKHSLKKSAFTYSAVMIALVVLCIPSPSRADAVTSLISALMGQGLGGGNGQFVNGDPANQVIPLLQQIYRQNADNGGINLSTERLQTETDIKRTTYSEQNQWERERRLRNDEIARSYPEMSNLSCAVATANQSAGVIDVAASNATGQAANMITNGMYKSVFLGTTISSKNKNTIWCKLGATGKVGTCDTAADKLVEGAHINPYLAIGIKKAIPCDMQGVIQEFEQMKNPDSWTPTPEHKECVAALLSIAAQYPPSTSYPTEQEAKDDNGTNLLAAKFSHTGIVGGAKGGLWEEFYDRVSVLVASTNCMKGIQGGAKSVYGLLQEKYRGTTRANKQSPFGLPPANYCLSKLLFAEGMDLLFEENRIENAGSTNLVQLVQELNDINAQQYKQYIRYASSANTGRNTSSNIPDPDNNIAVRHISSDNEQKELLGAIRQLTSAIQTMNSGVYSDKAQEVRLKKAAPAIAGKSAEITDALKEMGLKVSSPMPARNGVLPPLTQEFPVLPPR